MLIISLHADTFVRGAISLSQTQAVKYPKDNFMVTCKDDLGRPVHWTGPKGPLGKKSHPMMEVSSYGTSLVFLPIIEDDDGAYTCSVGMESNTFTLSVEGT